MEDSIFKPFLDVALEFEGDPPSKPTKKYGDVARMYPLGEALEGASVHFVKEIFYWRYKRNPSSEDISKFQEEFIRLFNLGIFQIQWNEVFKKGISDFRFFLFVWNGHEYIDVNEIDSFKKENI